MLFVRPDMSVLHSKSLFRALDQKENGRLDIHEFQGICEVLEVSIAKPQSSLSVFLVGLGDDSEAQDETRTSIRNVLHSGLRRLLLAPWTSKEDHCWSFVSTQ